MEMFFTNNVLYVNVMERVSFSLINKLKARLYNVIDNYGFLDIEINILNDEHFDKSLIDEFLMDYNAKYSGRVIIR